MHRVCDLKDSWARRVPGSSEAVGRHHADKRRKEFQLAAPLEDQAVLYAACVAGN